MKISMSFAEKTEYLFSYGTLQREEIQLSTFGRRLEGKPDLLEGYRLTRIPIQDEIVVATSGDTHYRNIQLTGIPSDIIVGTVFTVTTKELEQSDLYEQDADYKRVRVELKSGVSAWVYLNNNQS